MFTDCIIFETFSHLGGFGSFVVGIGKGVNLHGIGVGIVLFVLDLKACCGSGYAVLYGSGAEHLMKVDREVKGVPLEDQAV